MMTKEEFISSVKEVQNLTKSTDLFEKELNEVFSHFKQTEDGRLFNSFYWDFALLSLKYIIMGTFNVAENIASDESSYFMLECDWGNKNGKIEVDGKTYNINSVESFYDYLNDYYNKDEFGWEDK